MEKKENIWRKWLYWFIFAVAVIIVYKTLHNFSDITNWVKGIFDVLMPFIIGILLAYLFYIPCRNLEKLYEKTKWKWVKSKARGISVFTVYVLVLILIILAIQFIIPTLTRKYCRPSN